MAESAAAEGQTAGAAPCEASGEGVALEVLGGGDGCSDGAEVATDPAEEPQPMSAAAAAARTVAGRSALKRRLVASPIPGQMMGGAARSKGAWPDAASSPL